ncbi:ABC transporter permease [Roseibium sp.]|uniref:HoxN/HupN/NixA family nickel/cobalt transporter n=1 Tax=Roseibium sp. TaxID=1936156 RepID=UPI003BAFC4E5
MDWLAALQRWIYEGVRSEILTFEQSGNVWLLVGMAGTGVMFGALHALTPGHGKTILASWLAGSKSGFGRALSLSTLLAATHVLTAVLIAFFAAHLMERTFVGGGRAPTLEILSRTILLGFGLWLLLRALWPRAHQQGPEKREGLGVALATGLVPCPLTLFVVVSALARGVPEAGLIFALAMLAGIALTLGLVALAAVAGRQGFLALAMRRGAAIARVTRGLNALAGLLLIVFAGRELLQ